jgi:hypothetical protein
MKAGFGRSDITPAPGGILNGFIARLSPSRGVDTPLSARALCLEEGPQRALIVGFDLLGVTSATADTLAAKISRETGIEESKVILACTHTHSGPMAAPLRGLGPEDGAYLSTLEKKVVGAALEAAQACAPVDAGWGTGKVAIGVNRREPAGDGGVKLGVNPEGPSDSKVRVLCMKGTNRPILLFEHASHPYCLGPDDLLISADFWGHAAAALDQAGYDCLYLNGCAGNISPRQAFGGPMAARLEGRRLAQAVLQAAAEARLETAQVLRAGSRRLELDYDKLPPLDEIEAQLRQPDRTVREEDRTQSLVRRRLHQAWEEWLNDLSQALDRGPLPPVPTRISLLRLGRGAFVFLPGEVFFEIGERTAAMLPADPVAVAAYSHGYIGYVPTAEAYAEGGYEPNESHRYVGLWRLHPGTGARLSQAARDLWQELENQS